MELVFASNNAHKLAEIRKILTDAPVKIYSLSDLDLNIEIVEDGNTFKENALLKAHVLAKRCKLPALADDSGLEVDALDGAPGIRSARFAGENATDRQNNQLLLEKLKDVLPEKRTARFRCVLAFVTADGEECCWEGTCEGLIGYKEQGSTGFGYDQLFIIPKYQKTLAQLGPGLKNQISHRAQALKQACPFLLNWLSGKI